MSINNSKLGKLTKDIVVLGGGLAGLMTAYYAAKSGREVLVLEAKTSMHSASAGIVGAMAPHMPENWNEKKEYQFHSIQMAGEFWPEIEALTGLDTGFRTLGRWQAVKNESELSKAKMRSEEAKISWRGLADWRVIPCDSGVFFLKSLAIIEDTLAAQIFPRQAVLALHQACISLGVQIKEYTEVQQFESGKVQADETYLCDALILAGGYPAWPHFRTYLGSAFGEGAKGQAVLLRTRKDWVAPMITGDGYYIVPHTKRLLGVGSTSERYWTKSGVEQKVDGLLEKLESELVFPEYDVVESWAGIRPRAFRPDPLIGELDAGIFVNAGGFKTGFSFMNKLAQDLVQMVNGKEIIFPHNFDVKKQLIINSI